MVRLEQALVLDPESELHFKGPYDDETTAYMSTAYLKLYNPTEQRICFKLKTTAPKTYCVRPNSGVLNPNDTVTVAVMLYSGCVKQTDKGKHKFMVQTIVVPEGTGSIEELWRNGSANTMNSKLRCVFDLLEVGQQTQKDSIDGATEETAGVDANNDGDFITITPTQTCSLSAEEARLELENKQLKVLISSMQQENTVLKEKNQSRKESKASNASAAVLESSHGGDGQPATKMSFIFQHIYILCAFMFVIGLLIGQNIFHTS